MNSNGDVACGSTTDDSVVTPLQATGCSFTHRHSRDRDIRGSMDHARMEGAAKQTVRSRERLTAPPGANTGPDPGSADHSALDADQPRCHQETHIAESQARAFRERFRSSGKQSASTRSASKTRLLQTGMHARSPRLPLPVTAWKTLARKFSKKSSHVLATSLPELSQDSDPPSMNRPKGAKRRRSSRN